MSAVVPLSASAGPAHPWRDAAVTALLAAVLLFPLVGLRTMESTGGLTLQPQLATLAYAVATIFIGRLLTGYVRIAPVRVCLAAFVWTCAQMITPAPTVYWGVIAWAWSFLLFQWGIFENIQKAWITQYFKKLFTSLSIKRSFLFVEKGADLTLLLFVALLTLLPLLPFTDRYMLDVLMMVLTYAALAYGLNIVVGYTGLLDLGYVAFYAIGAYACALLGKFLGFSFWLALPCAGALAVLVAGIIGGPVLRLRGDYLAIVTLGLAEITRLMLINAVDLTGGPNGLSGVPRPTLLGLEFAATGKGGAATFHEFFGLSFSPVQRLVFLYYLLLALAVGIGWLGWALRRLPIGRAWEAVREDEIAAAAMGINRARVRLCAYMLGALCAGLCGAFFAARQGFVSPESFTFNETATVLAIVVLGGIGHPLGIALAALFIIGLPELFRELEQFRMLAFGAGMVLVMIWRPGGLMATRQPAVTKHSG